MGRGRSRARSHPASTCSLGRTTARDDAIVDVAARELLERPRRQLLVARSGTARELVERAGILGSHEYAEVLVGGVLGNLDRCEDSHVLVIRVWYSLFPTRAAR